MEERHATAKPLINHPLVSNPYLRLRVLISCILIWPTLILVLATLQHLYIRHTYLLDTGYWIALSTKFNPLLIEPSSINPGYSYFNTHNSPFFLALQIAYWIFRINNPPLYFAVWFSFLGMLPIVICVVASLRQLAKEFCRSQTRIGIKENLLITFFLILAASLFYINSAPWQNSLILYPHTEIIGIQLVGAGWLTLAYQLTNQSKPQFRCSDRRCTLMGLTLILFGSLFHELIAFFALICLISLGLYKRKKSLIYASRGFRIVFSIIVASTLIWLALRLTHQLPGAGLAESALTRIYLGQDPLAHLSINTYCTNLLKLANNNKESLIFLGGSIVLPLITRSKNNLMLYILPVSAVIAYALASPIAIHTPAAVLDSHYNYPMGLGYFFFCYALATTASDFKIPNHRRPLRFAAIGATGFILTISMIGFGSNAKLMELTDNRNLLNTQYRIREKPFNAFIISSASRKLVDLIHISLSSNEVITELTESHPLSFDDMKIKANAHYLGSQPDTVFFADHRLVALYPNHFGYSHLIAPFRNPNSMLEQYYDSDSRLYFLSMHPEDPLDTEHIISFIDKKNLTRKKIIPLAHYSGKPYFLTIFGQDRGLDQIPIR